MKIRISIIVLAVSVFTSVTPAQSWFGRIEVLKTQISDVQNLVNKNPEFRGNFALFELKEGNLRVEVSQGECEESTYGRWNVPKSTVISLIFYPTKKKKLTALGLDLGRMKKGMDSGQRTYIDEKSGMMYWVQFNRVEAIGVFPGTNLGNLRCRSN